MNREDEGFSMPLGASAYTSPPYQGGAGEQISHLMLIDCESDPAAVESEIPFPLKAVNSKTILWLGDVTVAPSNYAVFHECGLIHYATYQKDIGGTCSYVWTESDEAMLIGREVYGFPKMLCDKSRLHFDGGNVRGEIVRRGELLIRAGITLEYEAPADELPPIGPTFFFVRKFPSPEREGKAIRQLIRIDQSFEILSCWKGRASVEFMHNSQFPIHKLQPVQINTGFLVRARWELPHARIVNEG